MNFKKKKNNFFFFFGGGGGGLSGGGQSMCEWENEAFVEIQKNFFFFFFFLGGGGDVGVTSGRVGVGVVVDVNREV